MRLLAEGAPQYPPVPFDRRGTVTLTDMMPSLRRTLPDPLDVDRWPEASHATTTDVVVAGVA